MDKFVRSFITVEKSIQMVALVGVILFLGYLGFTNSQSNLTPSAPVISPRTEK
jgi:hypothetical protein